MNVAGSVRSTGVDAGREVPVNIEQVRADFPILAQRPHGKKLVYLDSAATTQKPRQVIEALTEYYSGYNANIHRGIHFLSEKATAAYEAGRGKAQRFLGAEAAEEIVFVRGTTEGINLVANTFVRTRLQAGDEILITGMEHHSNIVPWQMLCEQTGALLRHVPLNVQGEASLDEFKRLLSPRTRFASIVHISNALGTINPVREMIQAAKSASVPVLVDGAQAAAHVSVNVKELDCDFYCLSGHKLYGPTGIGVLYGKREHLEAMPPYQGGGEMISSVTFEKTTYNRIPHKFEAGTPNIAGVIGLGAAIDYVSELGLERIAAHENRLLAYALEKVASVPGVRFLGAPRERASIVSFSMDGVHPHDMGTILDREGIAIRAGHHCAQPVMERFGIPATARASFGVYNTTEEVNDLVRGLSRVKEILG